MLIALSFLLVLSVPLFTNAVTIYTTLTRDVYGSPIEATGTTALPTPVQSLPAYDPKQLTPPPLPTELPASQYTVQLYPGGMTNMSMPQKGNFLGFSIELSVANQIVGTNSSRLAVPFLNYIGGLRARGGAAPNIRIGGNTQEKFKLFPDGFENHQFIMKTENPNSANPTFTPDVDIASDLIYAMMNISALVGVDWYFGLPFADPTNVTGIATIAAFAQQAMGDRLIALQMGNEPDLYGIGDRKRPGPYQINNFTDEWGKAVEAMNVNTALTKKQILLGPSICCNLDKLWDIQQVIDAGFFTTFADQLKVIAVQHYPHANCDKSNPEDAQTKFPEYLSHTMAKGLVSDYLGATAYAQAQGKPFVMFETNTASCGGYVGLSDSFGAALWGVDYALQMAAVNFTNALFHFGGQNVAYNPFTPSPGTIGDQYQWTTGPLYYTMLMVAEALGPSNASQVVDLNLNFGNEFTPGYAIYENGQPTKVVLINFMNADANGNGNVVANILIGAGGDAGFQNPTTVNVRYLSADSVSQKYNITWSGQTMGGPLQSDGRLQGDEVTTQVTCDPTKGCSIPLKGPSAALVFLTTDAMTASSPKDPATETFATSTQTGRYAGGATIDQAVLATSNGRGGHDALQLKSTSVGKKNTSAASQKAIPVVLLVAAMAWGATVVGRSLVR